MAQSINIRVFDRELEQEMITLQWLNGEARINNLLFVRPDNICQGRFNQLMAQGFTEEDAKLDACCLKALDPFQPIAGNEQYATFVLILVKRLRDQLPVQPLYHFKSITIDGDYDGVEDDEQYLVKVPGREYQNINEPIYYDNDLALEQLVISMN